MAAQAELSSKGWCGLSVCKWLFVQGVMRNNTYGVMRNNTYTNNTLISRSCILDLVGSPCYHKQVDLFYPHSYDTVKIKTKTKILKL